MQKPDYRLIPLFDLFLIIIAVLFVVVMLMRIEEEEADITSKIEFMITTTWPTDNPCDVDSWLKDPNGKICWYQQRDVGAMHLDRDDLGNANDIYYLPNDKTIVYPYNQELTSIRACIPGIWTFNVHMFRERANGAGALVEVKIEKINPDVEMVHFGTNYLTAQWEEQTVMHFELDEDCEYVPMGNEYEKIATQMQYRPQFNER